MNIEIVKYPDTRLKTKSATVTDFDEAKKLDKAIRAMIKTLWGTPVGLAAPQVGYNIRMFVALGKTYVNPIVMEKSLSREKSSEGCYSLEREAFFDVNRAKMVKIKYQDLDGNMHVEKFDLFPAFVIQHEMDHLEGKLCSGV